MQIYFVKKNYPRSKDAEFIIRKLEEFVDVDIAAWSRVMYIISTDYCRLMKLT